MLVYPRASTQPTTFSTSWSGYLLLQAADSCCDYAGIYFPSGKWKLNPEANWTTEAMDNKLILLACQTCYRVWCHSSTWPPVRVIIIPIDLSRKLSKVTSVLCLGCSSNRRRVTLKWRAESFLHSSHSGWLVSAILSFSIISKCTLDYANNPAPLYKLHVCEIKCSLGKETMVFNNKIDTAVTMYSFYCVLEHKPHGTLLNIIPWSEAFPISTNNRTSASLCIPVMYHNPPFIYSLRTYSTI